MECINKDNTRDCSCTKLTCKRRGKCCLCVRHHRGKGELPGCFFTPQYEATHDRSVANFLRMHNCK